MSKYKEEKLRPWHWYTYSDTKTGIPFKGVYLLILRVDNDISSARGLEYSRSHFDGNYGWEFMTLENSSGESWAVVNQPKDKALRDLIPFVFNKIGEWWLP